MQVPVITITDEKGKTRSYKNILEIPGIRIPNEARPPLKKKSSTKKESSSPKKESSSSKKESSSSKTSAICKGIKKNGEKCVYKAKQDGYCLIHLKSKNKKE